MAVWLGALVLLIQLAFAQGAPARRLAAIETRGALHCGIWPHVPGFATGLPGQESGFEIDICRAVAAAILGDAARVRFTALSSVAQWARHPEIDLVVRRLTWTLPRETGSGLTFGPVIFYDGQGFLVPAESGVKHAAELAGRRICVLSGEHHALTLQEYFRATGRAIGILLVDTDQEAEEDLRSKRCAAYAADVSWLAAARSSFADGPARYAILPDQISKEPLAPLVRAGDTELLQLVRWTVFTMIEAEELGIDSRNIGTLQPGSAAVRAFLKARPDYRVAPPAGGWVRAIIAGVGNYGEVFDRNLGAGSAIKLDRGLNRLWTEGGLLYAPPLAPPSPIVR